MREVACYVTSASPMPSFQGMGLHRLQIFGTYMRGHNQILHGDQTRREAIFFTRSTTNADARSVCGN